ncbi:DgyrCDS9789 [Dimorphilus gyrociliatus]|uniref:Biogenesis of lysosome-related organelles complex 1 subunit 7 n=1 Tax=Dimorphilus gyrociliatus TaxID=2664684 RepID=A0A7I8W0R1_9ANNE|nr:DgyrCDS9789 [Dimorphilus gyrociliatus]
MSSEEEALSAPGTGRIAGEYDTQEAVTEGLLSLLTPAVQEVDDRVRSVRQSQVDLQHSIEILNDDLKKISESHGIPADLNPYVKKLNNTRRRINIVNNILQNAQVCTIRNTFDQLSNTNT